MGFSFSGQSPNVDNNEQCVTYTYGATDRAMLFSGCLTEVGISVGAVIAAMCLVLLLIAAIVVPLCLWR